MSNLTVTRKLHFQSGRRTKKIMRSGVKPKRLKTRTPRISKLMALAIHFDQMLRSHCVEDMAALARCGQVSRARITQIMNLLLLAPDIQEEILFLPETTEGRDAVSLRELQAVAAEVDWEGQRMRWECI